MIAGNDPTDQEQRGEERTEARRVGQRFSRQGYDDENGFALNQGLASN